MSKKLGRNEPCWCGSGLKYKHCHLNRENQTEVSPQGFKNALSKSFDKRYCLHPLAGPRVCQGNIIKAHTIQRNGGLSRIARDGHVYSFLQDFFSLTKMDASFQPKLVGIKQASTFTGFCSFHDNQTFEPIEKNPFQSSEHHAFLLGFRALSRELFLKRGAADFIPFQKGLDKGKTEPQQWVIQDLAAGLEEGIKAGLRDMEYYKTCFDSILLNKDYSPVQYYVIRLDKTPEFLCAGAIYPEYDFQGNVIQNLTYLDQHLDIVTFSLIATETGGAAVFAWLDTTPKSEKFIASLHSLTDNEIPHAIFRFTFEHFENVFISPDWWDSLDDKLKKRIGRRIMLAGSPESPRLPNCLKDDGLKLVSWKVTSRETNVKF